MAICMHVFRAARSQLRAGYQLSTPRQATHFFGEDMRPQGTSNALHLILSPVKTISTTASICG